MNSAILVFVQHHNDICISYQTQLSVNDIRNESDTVEL